MPVESWKSAGVPPTPLAPLPEGCADGTGAESGNVANGLTFQQSILLYVSSGHPAPPMWYEQTKGVRESRREIFFLCLWGIYCFLPWEKQKPSSNYSV